MTSGEKCGVSVIIRCSPANRLSGRLSSSLHPLTCPGGVHMKQIFCEGAILLEMTHLYCRLWEWGAALCTLRPQDLDSVGASSSFSG